MLHVGLIGLGRDWEQRFRPALERLRGYRDKALARGKMKAAEGATLLDGREGVVPEDVQAVLPGVAGHRLRPVHDGVRHSSLETARHLVSVVPIP